MSRTTFDDKGNFSVNEILQFSKALLTTSTYYFEWKDQRQKLILPDNFSASIYYTAKNQRRVIDHDHHVTFEFVKEVILLVVTTNTTKSFPYFTILVFVQEGSRPMITGFDLRTSHLSPTIIVVKHDK